jgi:hypothetical protein
MMCVEGYSPGFPSNLGKSNGSFVGITSHEGLWKIGSFVKREKSGKSNIARKGNGI